MTELLLLGVPLCTAIVALFVRRDHLYVIEYTSCAAALSEMTLALTISWSILTYGSTGSTTLFAVDALGSFIVLCTSFVGLAAAIHSVGHLREEMNKGIIGFRRVRQYYTLFHLFFFAMFVAATTTSPLIMWAAIEATTLATAFLISFYGKPSALEAGWKHLILNSLGLLLGFLGTLLFLNAAANAGAHDGLVSWTVLNSIKGSLDPILVKIAFIFVLVGFGTKVGFVPMHTWLPDAHSKAPVPISSLLSGVLLNMALIVVLRFRSIVDATVDPSFTQHLLIGFGMLSLCVAALIIFSQKNYKRMLAYSSIENMGIMAIGFGLGGIASVAALFHMLYHALLKPILFFCAGNFFLKYSSTKIAQVRGAMTLVPFSASIFFAALLAIGGMPPSGIFFTKLGILSSGMQNYPYLMIVVIIALCIIFAGFLRAATSMLFSEAPVELPKGESSAWTIVSIGFLSLTFVVLSVYVPAPLTSLIEKAATLIL